MGNIYEELKEEGRQEGIMRARLEWTRLWKYFDTHGMKDKQMEMIYNPDIIPEWCEKYGITVNGELV